MGDIMAYNALGNDIPLILQGGGAYNVPATPGLSPLLVFGALGIAAAYLIVAKGGGGKLW